MCEPMPPMSNFWKAGRADSKDTLLQVLAKIDQKMTMAMTTIAVLR